MLKTSCATIALIAIAFANPALAAGCASSTDAAALKTAVLQQELMVAGFQCHEAGAYNRFVVAYRPELQSSDAALKAFFVRRGGEHGEAGYDTFKTKAANLSALEQARDSRSFCADAHAMFAAAMANHGTLASFVEARSGATDIGNICVESRPTPVVAKAEIHPVEKPVLMASAAKPVIKVADARPAYVATDIGGVPVHSLPAMPYRHEDATPSRVASRDDARDEDDARPVYASADEDDAAPPPRPRYYQVRNQDEDRSYYPPQQPSYGPPQNWRENWQETPPPPTRRWYPQSAGYYYGNGW